jgi:hypothetical protein
MLAVSLRFMNVITSLRVYSSEQPISPSPSETTLTPNRAGHPLDVAPTVLYGRGYSCRVRAARAGYNRATSAR